MNARRRAVAAALLSLALVLELPAPVPHGSAPSASNSVLRASAMAAPPLRPHAALPAPKRLVSPPLVHAPTLAELQPVPRPHDGGGLRHDLPVPVVAHDSRHAPPDPHAMLAPSAQRVVPGRAPSTGARQGSLTTPPGVRRATSVVGGSGCNATPSSAPSFVQADPGTGINPWWRFVEGPIPGVGRYYVNVASQNLLIQADDMDVHNAGIDLAFRRTVNSMSHHDVNGSDGVTPTEVGNAWTSTFDAHLSGSVSGGLTVSDIDGARYDYSRDGQGNWTSSTAGQHATLTTADGGATYQWTKKSGSAYIFAGPFVNNGNSYEGYNGRLLKIYGRNRNTFINLTYYWVCGDAASNANLAEIDASTQAGVTAKLYFGSFAGHQLLSRLVWPDGKTTVTYNYNAGGVLINVQKPGPNDSGAMANEVYVAAADHALIENPRYVASNGAEGGYLNVSWSPTTGKVLGLQSVGVMNFTPPDTTNVPLQPGLTTNQIQYNFTAFTNVSSGLNQVSDTDGHDSYYYFDSSNRVTEVTEWTDSQWLATFYGWDAANNLVADVDARGYETDYAYDGNGNTVAVGSPMTTITTSSGTSSGRPTQLLSYDSSNNVIASCDQAWSHANGKDWNVTGNPGSSDSLCPQQAGATRMTYSYPSSPNGRPSYEPNGELQSITTPATANAPAGYTRRFTYDAAQQGGTDFGLPTRVQGDAIAQLDNTTRTPQQTFWYDATGALRCYSKGVGLWSLTYDVMGRITSAADPDDSSANGSSACGKTTGRPQWNTQTAYAYFPNGQMSSSQTPAERVFGVSSASTYDLDGNQLTESHHYACATQACAGTTTSKWYDGADRLIEVALPHDINDFYPFAWLTRYIYDVSGGQSTAIAGQPVVAHGGLYKTQEWNTAPGASAQSWLDIKGNAFDALDRTTKKYTFQPGTNGALMTAALAYDADSARLGLLSTTTNPEGESAAYSYDERGGLSAASFSNTHNVTPNRTYGYDADGRRTTEWSSVYGTKLSAYDAAGALTMVREAPGGNMSSPASITYDSYPDGMRKDVNVSSALLNANQLTTESYRADGMPASMAVNYAGQSYTFSSAYTDAGRITSRTDPFTGRTIPNPTAPVSPGSTYAPTTWAYDTTGQLAGHGMPYAYSYNNITHDAEGHMLGWHTNLPAYGDVSMQFSNSNRGENVGSTLTTTTYGQISTSSVRLAHGAPMEFNSKTPSIDNLDPYNGVITAMSGYSEHDPYGDGVTTANCPSPNTTTSTYDRASRMLSHNAVVYDSAPITCGSDDRASRSSSYTYDAEDHTIQLAGDASYCVGWGGDGKAITFAGSLCGQVTTGTATDALHYDGDQILFVTTSVAGGGSALSSIRLGLLGSLGVGGNTQRFSVDDRDMAGTIVTSHDDAGYTGVSFGTKVWQVHTSPRGGLFDGGGDGTYTNRVGVTIPVSSGNTATVGSPGTVPYTYDGTDGFTVGGKRFQGVRVMDSETGHWTTPDAYAGNIHDPMSQKPFMWNRNNPYEYSDPSGYAPSWLERVQDFVSSLLRPSRTIVGSPELVRDIGPRITITNNAIAMSLTRFSGQSVMLRSAATTRIGSD